MKEFHTPIPPSDFNMPLKEDQWIQAERLKESPVADLKAKIEAGNAEAGTKFELRGAYGNQELWVTDAAGRQHRLEAGSKDDVYRAWVKHRLNDKYCLGDRMGEGKSKSLDIGDGFYVTRVGNDANGNGSVWVAKGSGKAKKIQTNGNTPAAHRKSIDEIGESKKAQKEIKDYYRKYVMKEAAVMSPVKHYTSLADIQDAVRNGIEVNWKNKGYKVVLHTFDNGEEQWLVCWTNSADANCIGMKNHAPEDFFSVTWGATEFKGVRESSADEKVTAMKEGRGHHNFQYEDAQGENHSATNFVLDLPDPEDDEVEQGEDAFNEDRYGQMYEDLEMNVLPEIPGFESAGQNTWRGSDESVRGTVGDIKITTVDNGNGSISLGVVYDITDYDDESSIAAMEQQRHQVESELKRVLMSNFSDVRVGSGWTSAPLRESDDKNVTALQNRITGLLDPQNLKAVVEPNTDKQAIIKPEEALESAEEKTWADKVKAVLTAAKLKFQAQGQSYFIVDYPEDLKEKKISETEDTPFYRIARKYKPSAFVSVFWPSTRALGADEVEGETDFVVVYMDTHSDLNVVVVGSRNIADAEEAAAEYMENKHPSGSPWEAVRSEFLDYRRSPATPRMNESKQKKAKTMNENTSNRRCQIILDNGGGITLQFPGFAHYYEADARQAALDMSHYFNGDNVSEWDGNEIATFTPPTPEEIRNGGYQVFHVASLEDAEGQMADAALGHNGEDLLSHITPLLSRRDYVSGVHDEMGYNLRDSVQTHQVRWNESVNMNEAYPMEPINSNMQSIEALKAEVASLRRELEDVIRSGGSGYAQAGIAANLRDAQEELYKAMNLNVEEPPMREAMGDENTQEADIKVLTYDTWGNEEDGFEVNSWRTIAEPRLQVGSRVEIADIEQIVRNYWNSEATYPVNESDEATAPITVTDEYGNGTQYTVFCGPMPIGSIEVKQAAMRESLYPDDEANLKAVRSRSVPVSFHGHDTTAEVVNPGVEPTEKGFLVSIGAGFERYMYLVLEDYGLSNAQDALDEAIDFFEKRGDIHLVPETDLWDESFDSLTSGGNHSRYIAQEDVLVDKATLQNGTWVVGNNMRESTQPMRESRQVMEIRMLAGGKFGIFEQSMRGAKPVAKANTWAEARHKISEMLRDQQDPGYHNRRK